MPRRLWDPEVDQRLTPLRNRLQRLYESLSFTESGAASVVRDPAAITDLVTRTYAEVEKGTEAVLRSGLAVGGQEAAEDLAIVAFSFNEANPQAVAWAATRSGELVTQVSAQQVDALRTILTRAVGEGKGARLIRNEIMDTVGLHTRYANAVHNFREAELKRLTVRHPRLAETVLRERADKKARTYAKRLHKARAESIGRTELNRAANEGQMQSWRQAGEADQLDLATAQREYIANPGTRHGLCSDLDGTIVAFEEDFPEGDPPIHPNCVCAMGLVT